MREEKNATLKPDVLALLAEQAETEGKTVDDLLDEAARKLIETRRTVSGLRPLVAENLFLHKRMNERYLD